MANKALNESLDAHFEKVQGTPVSNTKPSVKKQPKKRQSNLPAFITRLREYLFPTIEFETQDINDKTLTIVERVDKGIHQHINKLKEYLASFSSKKVEEKEKEEEPEDVDISKVKEVMRTDKVK